MRHLALGIGTGNQRTRLAQAEFPLAEETSALPRAQTHTVLLLQIRRQCFAVPQIAAQSEIGWPQPQRRLRGLQSKHRLNRCAIIYDRVYS
jgi:hypothetical protein